MREGTLSYRLKYVYLTYFLRISYVYLTCILRVSYVYLTCILRVSYVYPTCYVAQLWYWLLFSHKQIESDYWNLRTHPFFICVLTFYYLLIRYTALTGKNIQAGLIFFARLLLSLDKIYCTRREKYSSKLDIFRSFVTIFVLGS